MKKIILSLLFIPFLSISQNWVDMMQDPNINFYETQNAFNNFWEGKSIEKGKGWKQFKRWENFIEPRVYPNGNIQPEILYNEYLTLERQNNNFRMLTPNTWTQVGPDDVPLEGSGRKRGIGRLNSIVFHPTNPDILYVGAPAGGFWKSTDAGQSWSTSTDFLTNLGVSDIAIHPTNPDTIFIITGDRDAGDTYSYGVMKSYDGGNSWQSTGLSFNINLFGLYRGNRILIDPVNPNIIIAATSNGVYRSIDGGDNFSLTFSGENLVSMEFHATNSNIIFAGSKGNTTVYKSSDNGVTWQQSGSGLPSSNDVSRACIAVSNANPSVVYALFGNNNNGFYALYKSTDEGNTWTQQSNSPNLLGWSTDGTDSGGQAWYDLALTVSPIDENIVFVGGVNCWKSSDSGINWTLNTHWYGGGGANYMHADEHMLQYNTLNNKVYSANDGGLYVSDDHGNNWTDISDGLQITQFYKLGVSQTVQNLVIGGTQDNGTFLKDQNNWDAVIGGDGMECIIDYTNSDIMYGSLYYGDIRKSTNGGNSFSSIGPSNNGAWVTPYILDKTDPNTIYAGYDELYKSIDGGSSWNIITSGETNGGRIDQIDISKSNSDIIFFSDGTSIFKTDDGGSSWADISSSLPNSLYITEIEIHPTNPNRVWLTFSGYFDNEKVYFSDNGGVSWSNISGTLPNVPANCIVINENDSLETIYLGTDLGVFIKDSTSLDWSNLNSNTLPNVIVSELEIQYSSNKLFAATYGRGLWSLDLQITSPPIANFSVDDSIFCSVPATVNFTNNSSYSTSYLWDFGDGNTSTSSNPTHTYLNYGNYTVSLIATGPLGVDTIVYPSLINISTSNSCIVTLPSSGQGNTQTSCNGTLYDVGGPNGNYYDNCDSWITIEPAGATQVTLNFLDFDIEAPSSQTYCNWDYLEIFDGNSTSSPSLGQYCNSLTGSPGTITSSGGAITILLHADQSVNGRGFEVDWSCSYTNNYTLVMMDSWGDGWDGASWTATSTSSGTVFGPYTVSYAQGTTNTETFSSTDSCFTVVVGGGSYASEHTWALQDAIGDTIIYGGDPYIGSWGICVLGCTDPNAVNYDVLADLDDGSCIYSNCSIIVDSINNVSCYGANDGSLILSGTGGTGYYNYSLNTIDSITGNLIPFTNTGTGFYANQINVYNVPQNCYVAILSDSLGCSDTIQICITQPANIEIDSITTANPSSTLSSDGSITIDSISGGTSPYTYLWSGPNGFLSTSQNISSLSEGLYTVVVTDMNGCQKFYSFLLLSISIPGCTDSLALNYDSLATIDDGSCYYALTYVPDDNFENYLEANGMGDGIALNDSVLTSNISSIDSLYIESLFINDLTGIEDFISIQLLKCAGNLFTTLDLSNNTLLKAVFCENNIIDSINLTQNLDLEYLFVYNNQLSFLDVSNNTNLLSLNCYTNQLTNINLDNNTLLSSLNCHNNQLTTLGLTNNIDLTNLFCYGNQINYLDLSTNLNLKDLYCDGNNLSSIDISNNPLIDRFSCQINQLTSLDVRNGNNLNFTVFNAGGNPNLICINVDDSTYSTNNWNNIDPQSYFSNNCNDIYGCTDVTAINYNPSANVDDGSCIFSNAQVEITSVSITNPILCNGGLADIYLTVNNDSGGFIPPVTYQLKAFKSDSIASFSYISTNQYASSNISVSGIDSSFYYLLVVDSVAFATAYPIQFFTSTNFINNVINHPSVYDFDTLLIVAPDAITSSSTEISANACYGDNIAQEQLLISGGTLPYFVDGNIISGTDTIFSNLSGGTYTFTIDDGNSCSTTASFTINEPNELIPGGSISSDYNGQNISCFGASDGEITAASTGGSGIIEYSIDGINYSSNNVFSGLSAGTYTIYYKDVNNCISFENFTLNEPLPLTGSFVTTDVSCYGMNDGSIISIFSGGTPTYLFSINGGSFQSSYNFNNLYGGQFYEIAVIDANGCSYLDSIFIQQPDNISVSSTIVDPSSTLSSDGSITIDSISGGTPPYLYIWTGPNGFLSTSQNISSLTIGTYTVVVTDIYGCSENFVFSLTSTSTPGCTDSTYCNYDPNALVDDGSCSGYYGCTDSTQFNYDPLAGCDDGSCIPFIYGCTDSLAYNYDPLSNTDDGSCTYSGCTDSLASNYDPIATIDDGSCIYSGCTDSLASNYNPIATVDNGSCYYGGCQTPAPINLYVDEITDTRATVHWDNMNIDSCKVLKYVIRYRELGTNSWTTKSGGAGGGLCIFGLNNTSKILYNLNPGTTYQYKIKAYYCVEGPSVWTLPKLFSTLDTCPPMTNLSVQTYSNNPNKATFNWNATGPYVFARVALRVNNNASPWQTAGGFGVYYPTLTVNKFGLLAGTDYRAQGRTFCDSNITAYRSWWTAPILWTQPNNRMNGGSTISNLDVYPNPSRDVFNITFNSDIIQDLNIKIFNSIGQVIFDDFKYRYVGEYVKQLNLENYSKGVYLLEIQTGQDLINKKLILK